MFVPTRANVKLAYGNTVHDQFIGIILYWYHNCPNIYPVGLFYYCPGHTSNKISLVPLNVFFFKMLHQNHVNTVSLCTLESSLVG